MKRGEVWWAEIKPRSGSEQSGARPVVIVSHDGFNLTPGWKSVMVVPFLTSKPQARRGPTAVLVPAGEGGLARDSVALCHQVTTLDRAKLTRCLGILSAAAMEKIETGLLSALDLF